MRAPRRGAGPSAYVSPLPKGEWETSRTDQGVDFVNKSASSRILAIGRAKILSIGAAGWPGSGGVLYELLDGPRKGQVVYNYENVKPQVRAGQEVQAGQVIATMKGTGYPWLEMGFATRAGVPISHGEYTEGKETRAGKAFKAFLATLHAGPAGVHPMTPAEKRKLERIAGEENLGEPFLGVGPNVKGGGLGGVAESLADQVINGILGDLAKSAEPLMLNIGLVGGGAFLVYYGAALMLGVQRPGAALAAPLTKGVPAP